MTGPELALAAWAGLLALPPAATIGGTVCAFALASLVETLADLWLA